jgi:PadR family transcriptional regulator, regulatory protein PadR
MSHPNLPSPKEAEILELLLGGVERYGLELVTVSGGSLKRGTIYVLLDRLEEKRFVSSRVDTKPNVSGLARRLYKITGLGAAALAAYQHAREAMNRAFSAQGA